MASAGKPQEGYARDLPSNALTNRWRKAMSTSNAAASAAGALKAPGVPAEDGTEVLWF